MTIRAHIDFETFSDVPLPKAGVYRYCESPHTGVFVLSWRIGDQGPINRWHPGAEDPLDLLVWIEEGGEVVAHNAGFERSIWNRVVRRRYAQHWPELKIGQQICTMARAAALAMPAGLDALSFALKTPVQKDKEGYALMMRMCKVKDERADGTPVFHTDPALIERLSQYCDVDVETETLVDSALPFLSPTELAVWQLDQLINERGVAIDETFVRRALDAATELKSRADEKMWHLTDGDIQRCTETAKIVKWINDRGVPCQSVAKGETEELVLGAELQGDKTAKDVVMLRRAAAKASTAKYSAMQKCVCADGRVRGMLAYHGASTGRWAGRLVQPQNFPRVDPDADGPDVELVLQLLESPKSRTELADAIEMLVEHPIDVLSKCLRAMFVAPKGKKFVGGDFANIEGRFNAWLAGEEWKLRAFRDYDRGSGPDLYKVTSARITGKAVADVTKGERQATGKVPELALGYQGGVGAFINMAANYFVKPEDVARVARDNATDDQWAATEQAYERMNSYGLSSDTWRGVKLVVDGWRAANANIVQGWWDLQDAAIAAVGSPGVVIPVDQYQGRVRYIASNGFLFCSLPSRRVLAYANPRLIESERFGRKKYQVLYDGVDSMTKRWGEQYLYGGEQCNHVVQGTARDLMVSAMMRAEADNYPVILTVHDEIVCEVTDDEEGPQRMGLTDADLLKSIMSDVPAWAEGLPLAAATWEDQRYVK